MLSSTMQIYTEDNFVSLQNPVINVDLKDETNVNKRDLEESQDGVFRVCLRIFLSACYAIVLLQKKRRTSDINYA